MKKTHIFSQVGHVALYKINGRPFVFFRALSSEMDDLDAGKIVGETTCLRNPQSEVCILKVEEIVCIEHADPPEEIDRGKDSCSDR